MGRSLRLVLLESSARRVVPVARFVQTIDRINQKSEQWPYSSHNTQHCHVASAPTIREEWVSKMEPVAFRKFHFSIFIIIVSYCGTPYEAISI